MISLGISLINEKLCARTITRPTEAPYLTYYIEDEEIGVWLERGLTSNSINSGELDNLIWVTITNKSRLHPASVS